MEVKWVGTLNVRSRQTKYNIFDLSVIPFTSQGLVLKIWSAICLTSSFRKGILKNL